MNKSEPKPVDIYIYLDRVGNSIDLSRTMTDPQICDNLADSNLCKITLDVFRPHVERFVKSGAWAFKKIRLNDSKVFTQVHRTVEERVKVIFDQVITSLDCTNAAEKFVELPNYDALDSKTAFLAGRVFDDYGRPLRYDDFQKTVDLIHLAALDYRRPDKLDVVRSWLRLNKKQIEEMISEVISQHA